MHEVTTWSSVLGWAILKVRLDKVK
jgi:hypothetical protein